MLRCILLALLPLAGAIWAQPADDSLAFEVASVKPATPDENGRFPVIMRGGPGSRTPGQIVFTGVSIHNLMIVAFGVTTDQIAGPQWIEDERYDVTAKVPVDATMDQYHTMLRNLLKERFHLTLHHDTRELSTLVLTAGRNGLKLKTSSELPPGAAPPQPMMRMEQGRVHLEADHQTTGWMAKMAASLLGQPAVDRTGLTGSYDFHLDFVVPNRAPSPAAQPLDAAPESDLFAALDEVGLKLEAKKVPTDILVVDRVDKIPVGN